MSKKRSSNIAVGALVAAGIGYAIGVLTAPKSGKETRRDIQRTALRAKGEAEQKLKKLHAELTRLIKQGKQHTKTMQSSAKTELVDALARAQRAKEKARELLTALHEGESNDQDLQKAISDVKKASEHLKKYMTKRESGTS